MHNFPQFSLLARYLYDIPVAFLNLMPNKIETERQWLHIICPQQHDLEWKPCITASYQPKHTPLSALLPRYTVGLPDAFDILVRDRCSARTKAVSRDCLLARASTYFQNTAKTAQYRYSPPVGPRTHYYSLVINYQFRCGVKSCLGFSPTPKQMQHAITQKLPKELYLPHSRYAFIAAEVLRN